MIKLINDTISKKDIKLLIEWLETYPRLTKGPLTTQFEKKWAQWLGTKHAVFVNSGSSANLLMLYALMESGRLKNKKVVIPNLCWATDLAPAIQLQYEPLLCDCNLDTLSVDLEKLEKIFSDQRPSVLLLVSVLGLSPDMDEVRKLCDAYEVILLEDTCESMGSQFKNANLGTFGLMSSFSTYFGHHISTIEGGMVCTDDDDMHDLLVSIRSHGWDRDWSPEKQAKTRSKYEVDDFDALYTFYHAGMNLRSTDLQAFIGINQIDKLDAIFMQRNKNFRMYEKYLKNPFWKPSALSESFTSNFAYPVIHPRRYEMVEALRENEIEVRPLICGSMHRQPFYRHRSEESDEDFPNSELIRTCGFYLPNHPDLTEQDIKKICKIVNSIAEEEV